MKKTDSRARSIARYITQKLKEAGVFEQTLSYQVELVASDLLIYRKLRDACLQPDVEATITEESREGNPRIKVNPLFGELRRQSKIVQEGLDMLTMNIKSKKKKTEANDNLRRLMEAMEEEDD